MNFTNFETSEWLSWLPTLDVGKRSLRDNRDLKKHKEKPQGADRGLGAERKRHHECQQKLEKNIKRETTP